MDKYLYLDRKKESKQIAKVLMMGYGTQTIGLLLMVLDGKIKEDLDLVIFADTGSEPKHVYEYASMFDEYVKSKYGITIHRVAKGLKSLESDITDYIQGETETKAKLLPYFSSNNGMLMRQCTDHYKIRPIDNYLKFKFKPNKNETIEKWFGISVDEIQRMRISQVSWNYNRYPLIELELNRQQVISYVMKYHNLPEPPRSSCYFCPFHSTNYWRFLKNNHNEEYKKAIKFDKVVRKYPGMREDLYLHRDCRPLDKIDLTPLPSLFTELIDECNGYCGI